MGWRMNNNKRVLLLTLNKARVIIYSSYEYTLWSVVAIASVLFSIILILFYVLFVKRLIFLKHRVFLLFVHCYIIIDHSNREEPAEPTSNLFRILINVKVVKL
jgi:hypothetical protein